jgi:hypothetical protein
MEVRNLVRRGLTRLAVKGATGRKAGVRIFENAPEDLIED